MVDRVVSNPRKEQEKRKKEEMKQKKYWNSMITRKEAHGLAQKTLDLSEEKLRILFIQVKILTQLFLKKGLITEQELDEMYEQLHGKATDNISEATKK